MAREDEQDVVVVGAGLVGLACAYSLASNGVRPLVIDANEPGSGASWGNAGWVTFAPELVAPVPAPGVARTSLQWLVQRHSPLRLVPRLDWEYLRWLGRFTASCSSSAAAAGLRATLALNEGTANLFDALEREGLDFEMQRQGVLLVYRSSRGFEAARKKLINNDAHGTGGQVLSRDEALAEEPLLQSSACIGAIRHEGDRHVRPDKLVDALVQQLKRMGVEIRTQSRCVGVVRDGRKLIGLVTQEQTIPGRAFVLAAGTGLSVLAKMAGVRIPIEGGRGYSFDVSRDELPVRTPVYLYDGRLALTPFREITRIVGMMELGARSATVRPRAIETMNRAGAASFRTWPTKAARDAWAGLRPMTPDGLPVIGAVEGTENLYVAGGHGMLGVTLSLRTGEAIAQCVRHSKRLDPVLRPFSPSRFTSRPAS